MQIRTTSLTGAALAYAVEQRLGAATVLELLAQRITKLEQTPNNKFQAECRSPAIYADDNPFEPTYAALGNTLPEAVFRVCLLAQVGEFTEIPQGVLGDIIARRSKT